MAGEFYSPRPVEDYEEDSFIKAKLSKLLVKRTITPILDLPQPDKMDGTMFL